MTHADETMRNDPARRAAVAEAIRKRQDAIAAAREKIHEARDILVALGYDTIHDDPLVERCLDSVTLTAARFDRDAPWVLQEWAETYVGNKAAFGQPTGWVGSDE